tara:strand:- start:3138 stop:3359 length:222 start_codon:yes stop_codon:yes gene_type:complete
MAKAEKMSSKVNLKERKRLYGTYVQVRRLKQFNPINEPPMTFETFLVNYADKDFFKEVNDIVFKKVNNLLKGV